MFKLLFPPLMFSCWLAEIPLLVTCRLKTGAAWQAGQMRSDLVTLICCGHTGCSTHFHYLNHVNDMAWDEKRGHDSKSLLLDKIAMGKLNWLLATHHSSLCSCCSKLSVHVGIISMAATVTSSFWSLMLVGSSKVHVSWPIPNIDLNSSVCSHSWGLDPRIHN